MVSTKQLEEANVFSLIVKFSGPAVVGMLVMSIYNIVDRVFIGRSVGPLGIAGIAVGYPLMMIIMAVTMLVGIGATSLISIRLGEKRIEEAERVMGSAATLLVVISLALTVAGLLFLTPLLRLFAASDNILPYGREYMTIILFGTVFQVFSFGVNNFIRAEGNPKTAMFTMLIGAVLNLILDPIFIFVLGLGVAGAAWATIISQAVSALWVLSYFLRGSSLLKFRRANLRPDLALTTDIVSVGAASFFKQLVTSIILIILNNSLLFYGGDIAVSGMGVIHSIFTLLLMPVFGISQGVQPIIGYNYGARQFDRVKQALYQAILLATAIVVIGFIGIVLFAEPFIRLFNSDAELVAIGAAGLRTFLALLPILGFQIIGANYFQAVGKPRQAVFLNLSRQVLLLIPALLILPRFYGLRGIWLAGPVADTGSSIITAAWLLLEIRYLKRSEPLPLLEPQYEN
ncbi:MAG: MATE family efflux transporter [Dethiobacter sp.]|jgi:putative MATE family efflux protein|nr:MATE family efflux transporter [Dethiobacter sp.]